MMSGMVDERRELWFEHLMPSLPFPPASSSLAYLFPTQKHIRQAIRDGNEYIDWIEADLNKEQKKAIKDIATKQHDVPYLLFGPAGTGE